MIERSQRTTRSVIDLKLGGGLFIYEFIENEVRHYAKQARVSARDFFDDEGVDDSEETNVRTVLNQL